MAKAVDVTVVIPHLLFRKKICVLRVAILHRIFAKNYIILLLAARELLQIQSSSSRTLVQVTEETRVTREHE